jgi:ketosteroid isomerase-like protein
MNEQQLRQASDGFYAALRELVAGDASAMDGVWSHDPAVVTMHPLGGRQEGWDQVRASWGMVAGIGQKVDIDLYDETYFVAGNIGIVTGFERGDLNLHGRHLDYSARVTNVFCFEDGNWKAALHHVDESPALVALVAPAPARGAVAVG